MKSLHHVSLRYTGADALQCCENGITSDRPTHMGVINQSLRHFHHEAAVKGLNTRTYYRSYMKHQIAIKASSATRERTERASFVASCCGERGASQQHQSPRSEENLLPSILSCFMCVISSCMLKAVGFQQSSRHETEVPSAYASGMYAHEE